MASDAVGRAANRWRRRQKRFGTMTAKRCALRVSSGNTKSSGLGVRKKDWAAERITKRNNEQLQR